MKLQRVRLNAKDDYLNADFTCDICGIYIIKEGEAQMPIYYCNIKHNLCPSCKED